MSFPDDRWGALKREEEVVLALGLYRLVDGRGAGGSRLDCVGQRPVEHCYLLLSLIVYRFVGSVRSGGMS